MPAKKEPVGLVCIECGADFSVPAWEAKTRIVCSVACRNKRFLRAAWASTRKVGARSNGYLTAEGGYAHRAVMEKHLGRILQTDELVHHIDGNKDNNDIANLMLTTRGAHCAMHHVAATLSVEQVREIRASDEKSIVLARQYGVDRGTIWRIRARKAWKDVP